MKTGIRLIYLFFILEFFYFGLFKCTYFFLINIYFRFFHSSLEADCFRIGRLITFVLSFYIFFLMTAIGLKSYRLSRLFNILISFFFFSLSAFCYRMLIWMKSYNWDLTFSSFSKAFFASIYPIFDLPLIFLFIFYYYYLSC